MLKNKIVKRLHRQNFSHFVRVWNLVLFRRKILGEGVQEWSVVLSKIFGSKWGNWQDTREKYIVRSFMIYILHQTLFGSPVPGRSDWLSLWQLWGRREMHSELYWGNLKESVTSGNLDIDMRTIFRGDNPLCYRYISQNKYSRTQNLYNSIYKLL